MSQAQPKTVNDLIRRLIYLVQEDPKRGDLPIVYARDEEGNGFGPVYYDATPGQFDKDMGEFYCDDEHPDHDAVCIN